MLKKWTLFSLLGITALVAHAGLQSFRIFINGTETSDVIVRSGKTYVAVSALRDAGAEVNVDGNRVLIRFDPPVGRMQADAIEGRRGEWLHNGTWRVQVREVTPIENPFGRGPGYSVVVEFRNLTRSSTSIHATGLDVIQLIDSKGNVLSVAASGTYNKVYDSIPPGGAVTMTLRFGDSSNGLETVGEAEKLLILFKSSGGKQLKHFRVFLKDE